MSSTNSCSSSEELNLNDILPTFSKDFQKDFDFYDVHREVKDLFTKEEYESIMRENDEQRQVVRLLSVLNTQELIEKFLNRIKPYFEFLCEGIKQERNSPGKDTINYVDTVNMWRSNHPKHTDFNVLRLNWYIPLLKALLNLKPWHSVVLYGDLGMGKKWLTLHVCYDFNVMKAMNFQIFWLDVSDCNSPEQDVYRLQTLRLILGDTSASHSPTFSCNPNGDAYNEVCRRFDCNESISNRKLELQKYIRKQLENPKYRNCLLILKDVKNRKTVQTFNLGPKLLVITRNKKISQSFSAKMSTHLYINSGLTKDEFFSLFEKYLGQKREQFPENAIEIYEHSNGHPYLLSMIAQNLRERHTNANWQEWINNLKNFEINHDKFAKVVKISLSVLTKDQLKMYAVFSIFPHSVPIPVKLLATLWNKSSHDADYIVGFFHKFSFVSKERCNARIECDDDGDFEFCCCVLPFIYSTYLRTNTKIKAYIDSPQLHCKVIEHYNLEQAFNERTEIDFCNRQHDWYFFKFIGHHLQYSVKLRSLFSRIFLDFGFLEQKIRAVGLSNTIGDLKLFENEIVGGDRRKQILLEELREFLPKVEEKLTASKDTSLLQYALMASGAVYEEAKVQVRKFLHRVWFNERGSFHKRRHIVNLKNKAKCVYFLDQETCLVVLANNNMLLLDLALDCKTDPLILKNDQEENSDGIIEARLFRKNRFILTLDTAGALKVWSITDYHQSPVSSQRCSKQMIHGLKNPAGYVFQDGKRYKQRIQENSMETHGYIVAFYIDQLPKERNEATYLHIAFKNGSICIYKWDSVREEFAPEKVPMLDTKATDIRFFCKLLNKYYMLLTNSGDIRFWNLYDSSESKKPFEWPKPTSKPISCELYNHNTRIIIVFADMVVSLNEFKEFNQQLSATVKEIYPNRLDSVKISILCAKLSRDQRYLVLGTKHGLIVYDILSESEVLRSNVSDSIPCLDIHILNDRVFKYIIICGSQQRSCLNIFAVRTSEQQGITWAHNVNSMGNEASSDPQLEADVWLLGRKLFDVDYKEDGNTQIVAVDSKNRVHQFHSKTKNWSIVIQPKTSEEITSITTGKEMAFVGYSSGDILKIDKDIFQIESMEEPITYLQIFDDSIFVASTKSQTSIRNVNASCSTEFKIKNYAFSTKKSFKIFNQYLLLINEDGILLLIDLNSANFDIKFHMQGLPQPYWDLCCCDYQNDHLLLATVSSLTILKFKHDNSTGGSPDVELFITSDTSDTTAITAVALSKDAALVAIGFKSGDIKIHKMLDKDLNFLCRLQSHRASINDIKFSLGNEVLASCAESFCLWNVAYLLKKHSTPHSPKRRSSRFSSQRSSDIEEVDARVVMPYSGNVNNNFLQVTSPHLIGPGDPNDNHLNAAMHSLQLEAVRAATAKAFRDKRGPFDKPELLACIKFDGNKAEKLCVNPDFTQFSTIDDDGVYYHLVLMNDAGDDFLSSTALTDISASYNIEMRLPTDTNELFDGEDDVGI